MSIKTKIETIANTQIDNARLILSLDFIGYNQDRVKASSIISDNLDQEKFKTAGQALSAWLIIEAISKIINSQ